MEGEKRKFNAFWVKSKKLGYNKQSLIAASGEYQGMRLPTSPQTRAIQTFIALFSMVFTSMFIIVGCQPTATDAVNYPELVISSIDLETPVAPIEPVERQLEAPATIAGAYSQYNNKTLIIGHSTTVFKDLYQTKVGEKIIYGNREYTITKIETIIKKRVNMKTILEGSNKNTIVIMTCAGELLENQDATHRLLVTAVAR